MSWNQQQHNAPRQHDPPPARPPAGPAHWGGVAPWLHALGAVLAAFVAMAVAAWAALWLLGADGLGSGTMPALVAAVIALAVGGTVDLKGAEQGSPDNDILSQLTGDISLAQGSGKVDIMLLGIGLIGALVLGWLFLRPLRHRLVIGALDLIVHGVRVLVFTMAALGVVVSTGEHSLPIQQFVSQVGGAQDLMGIFDLGAAARFETDVSGTLVFGTLWLLITLVAAVAVSARGPLPLKWLRHRAVLRAPVAGLLAVLITAVVAGIVGTPFVAAAAPAPKRMIGGMLFALPNAVWLLASLGLGIPWKATSSAPTEFGGFSFGLPGPLGKLVKASAGEGLPIRIDRLAELDSRAWFVPLFSALLLLLGATVMAMRAPASVRPHQHAWRFAVALAGGLLVISYLMELQLKVAVTVLGGVMSPGASVSLHADYLWTVLLGLLWGACAGFIGGAVADWVRYRRTDPAGAPPAAGPPRPTRAAPPAGSPRPYPQGAPYPRDRSASRPPSAHPPAPGAPAPPGPPHSNRPAPAYRPPPPPDPQGPTRSGPWPG
ncbi:streptophobe family protein [Embleya sp. NBC_00888]|uniref:streptophobe family protein n=1 Tax=Embleya sp. NBC_00888 TaxID=2975960 RepID=UPI0038676307|nr:streptophobe family protein [Embleya sp. NBC_00888]